MRRHSGAVHRHRSAAGALGELQRHRHRGRKKQRRMPLRDQPRDFEPVGQVPNRIAAWRTAIRSGQP